MKYEVFKHFNYGVIDDFNQVIEFYLSPQPKENLQEPTEIKNLNGANIFLYLVFSAEYKGLTELFYYHLYGQALKNLLNMLRICLEKIPPYVNGDEFIPSQLRKMKKEIFDRNEEFKVQEELKLLIGSKHPVTYYAVQPEGEFFLLIFTMSQLYDPHVDIAFPILQFEIIELDKIGNKAERLFNFRITNLTRFFMDLRHFDPKFALNIEDLLL